MSSMALEARPEIESSLDSACVLIFVVFFSFGLKNFFESSV